MSLKLLHLSDIHFKTYDKDKGYLDLDKDIQNEIEQDLGHLVESIGPLQSILIGGDIAFSGKESEYETAHAWINKVCGIVGCLRENVLMVPGNHDIDRGKVSRMLKDVHTTLRRTLTANEIDQRLGKYLEEPADIGMLLGPLTGYNTFAQRYGTALDERNDLYWVKDLPLNDGQKLRIRGVNSVIVSNDQDHEHDSKLILGLHQCNIPRVSGVVNLVLCHHPPEWLYDGERVKSYFMNRASIQLFGHKHVFEVTKMNHSLVLSAGAMQPERGEKDWNPRYNILELDTHQEGGKRVLDVRICKRAWNDRKKKFSADFSEDGSLWEVHKVEYERIADHAVKPKNDELVSGSMTKETTMGDKVELIDVNSPNPHRKLVYLFLSLPYVSRLQIAMELGLVKDADEGLTEVQRSQAYFKRAEQNTLLEQLWDKVVAETNEPPDTSNPFKK